MREGLRRLFRSCRGVLPVLMVAGSALAGGQTVQTAPDSTSLRLPQGGHAQKVPGSATVAAVVDSIVPAPRNFLEPNAPNPFGITSETTRMAFSIAEQSHVRLRIYDFFYNEVLTLVDEERGPGRHVVQFRPPPTMPSGMYFYELETDRFRDIQRMVYIK